ncbi:MAG: hypothetical protein KKI09_13500, partial [Spirochaetes bacterium]|nr:hypothetical protein [Spirochaetota bacterium]MBU0956440.1 hypothetical protein [Spirochaetota bacterium]
AGIFRQRAAELAARRGWPEPMGSGSLTGNIGRRVCLMGVHTACKEVRTVGGESMCFKSFTDSDGVFETVLFPKVYTQIMPILECNTVFLLLGTVHVEFGALSVHIEAVDRLNRSA